jgi:hypothetical protein
LSRDEDNPLLTFPGINPASAAGMHLMAFSAAQQPTTQVTDAASEPNAAAWGTLLWVGVIAVVFFALLAAAVLGLIGRRTRE